MRAARSPGPALPVPQPAGQRLQRHRRGYGHQYPAPQPAGGHRRRASACWMTPTPPWQRPDGAYQGPRLPHPGYHHGPQRHPGRLCPSRAGGLMVRARHEFEEFGKRPHPHHLHGAAVSGEQADAYQGHRRSGGGQAHLEGISDIRDESDRNGMRMVIELKRDANPQVVLNRLFAQTQLRPRLPSICWRWWRTSASRRSSPCDTSSTSI